MDNTNSDNSKKNINFREILSWILYLGCAVVIALFITRYVVVNAYIPTQSMAPTINPEDKILANRLQYLVSEPKRGDIVVFKFPDNESVLYVKRVIGLPGDKVEIKDGKVYINGDIIDEPYIKEEAIGSFGPYNVPQGKYFMMGDNRNNSDDSRKWKNTYLEREKMLGKAFFKYYPGFKIF